MELKFNRTFVSGNDDLSIITRLPDKRYIYRYDIKQEPSVVDEEGKETKVYSYVPVLLKGFPNRNEVIKYLLRQLVSLENELKIVNDFNEVRYLSENYQDTDEYGTYLAYLAFRKAIKKQVREDFNSMNL